MGTPGVDAAGKAAMTDVNAEESMHSPEGKQEIYDDYFG